MTQPGQPGNQVQKQWFELLGESFAEQYYGCYKANRSQLPDMYHSEGMVTLEDKRAQGREEISAVLMTRLQFTNIDFLITKVDCQPLSNEGVVVLVTGRLKCDEDPAHGFSQLFTLVKQNNSYFILNDIFRLILHNSM